MTGKTKREKGFGTWPTGAWLVPFLLCAACAGHPRIEYQVFADVQIREGLACRSQACQGTIEYLLSEVWDSGFFCDDAELLQEILNNSYGIFECQNCPERLKRVRAFYLYDNNTERVMLNKSLFRQFKVSTWSGITLTDLDSRIKATLVHELLHDFWFHVLDDTRKARFTSEAEQFYHELCAAVSEQDKLDFLKRAGYANPTLAAFVPFEGVKRLRERYPNRSFFGTELFAVLADRAFSGRILIPQRFRSYYKGILSDRALGLTPF